MSMSLYFMSLEWHIYNESNLRNRNILVTEVRHIVSVKKHVKILWNVMAHNDLCMWGLNLASHCIFTTNYGHIFTRGQLWPLGIVVACVCVCVCLSVNHQLVCAISHQLFKLESPNSDQRCKRPWLRSLLFLGTIDLELQGQIELKSQNLSHFELVRARSHHPLKSVFPNFGQRCILALLRFLLNLGWIDLDVLFHF